jgi:RHS repeat-associated protein
MILNEETHVASNTCTMETTRSGVEEPIFGQTGASNEVSTTRYTKPAAWTGNSSTSVSRLGTTAGHNIGPNTLQKVMAGDKITASVQYYYSAVPGGNNTGFVSTMLGSLVQAISGANGATNLVKNNASSISTQLNGVTGFVNAVQPNGSNPGGTTPQAYLTILFFDERFKFIEAADGGVAQQQVAASVGSNGAPLGLNNVKAPKNGYVYVYVSNQSNNDVYFDDFVAGITTGNIIEENHYYAYGLKIATISSKKLGDSYEGALKNNNLYNDKELLDDADLNWYDYGFRNYDPQIGRFPQLDPLTDNYPFLTPYQYASGDPITNIDVDGLEGTSAVGGAVRDFSYSYNMVNDMAQFIFPITRTATTASAVSSGVNAVSKIINVTSIIIGTSIRTANIINNSITTQQAGRNAGTKAGGGGDDTEERLRILTTIAMCEGGHGETFNLKELTMIAWVYVNRQKSGKKLGAGSSVYNQRNSKNWNGKNYRMYMYALGSKSYATNAEAKKQARNEPAKIERAKFLLSNLECLLDPRNDMEKSYKYDFAQYPNIQGQGYHRDLNGYHEDPEYWNKVRWYIYSVYKKTIENSNTVFVILGSDAAHKNATFLFDPEAVRKYYEKNKDLIDKTDAPIYDPVSNTFMEKK